MNQPARQLSRYGWRPADPPRRPVLFSPAYRDAKLRTLLETAAEVTGPSTGELALDLADDLGHEHHHPAIVLVSNNPYALDRPLARGTRPPLDSGQLGIVVLDAPGDSPRVPGRAWSAPRLEVNAPAPVHAGVDGEAVDLEPPPRFASRPASPRIRISPRHPEASPSARLHLRATQGLPTQVMAHFLGTVVAGCSPHKRIMVFAGCSALVMADLSGVQRHPPAQRRIGCWLKCLPL
jgi:hypothetical protein